MSRLTRHIRETLGEVAEAAADAEAFCSNLGADEGQCLRIGLALDELAANALLHGSKGGAAEPADIKVEVWGDDEMLHLCVRAKGPRFDPRDKRAPQPGQEFAIGGRGLTLVLSFADKLTYAREDDRNVTTFSVVKRELIDEPDARALEDGGNEA